MRFSSAAAAAQLALPSSLVGIDTVPLIHSAPVLKAALGINIKQTE
jgi:hypothetical protein